MKTALTFTMLAAFLLLFGCIQNTVPPTEATPTLQNASPTPAATISPMEELEELSELSEADEELDGLEEELDDWLNEEGFEVSDEELDLFE